MMVLTYPTIHYPIKILSILGIWTTNFLISPTDAELMGGHILTREGHESLCLRSFPKNNLILMHYMLSALWLHLIDGIGHYVIFLVEV